MSINRYETVCIVKPDVGDETVKGIIQKVTSAIEAESGTVAKVDEWGRKRLAYPIEKKNEGYYFVIEFNCSGATSKEVGRILNLNEDVLRYQTIRLDEDEPTTTSPAEVADEAAATEAGAEASATEGGQE